MYLPALDCPKYDLKATVIKRFCQGTKRTYLSADWFGVGESTGDFAQGTVTRWTADTIKLIESLCPDSKMVLVGGGVGGWVALLVALQRPDLVAGIVGLGADPDFTENLLWKHLPEETKTEIMEKGSSQVTWGIHQYPISRALIEDGRRHLLLGGPDNGLDIMCPVRLVHGLQDEEVPLDVPLSLARRLRTQNVQVLLQKSGDHYLGDQADFALIKTALKDCIANYYEYDLTSPGSG
ncbi:Alpha/Beta hydrolase protein [Tribonema minus]|uniref:Palmitoyl-protein thioesterase ABHD10, mitochondrial n=1 Tax=Tribonema minus TaxID=303371 RepID=A0A836CDS8_9STRA|nr:Alpha/Beta hydrolase protein [Tribonema minus]